MTNIKYRLMLIMGYLGAVIGAGFASGQEIVQFFVGYGSFGFKGALLATALFAICGGCLLYLAHSLKVSNYQYILLHLLGPKLGKVVDFLLAIFLFLGISTMLSASGAVFYEHLYLPKSTGVFLAYGLVVCMLMWGKRGLIFSYNVIVPIKLVLLLIISGYAALFIQGNQIETYTAFLCPTEARFWIVSAILYVAYNFALAMVVLTEYQNISGRRDGIWGSILGGLVLGLLVTLNYMALSKFLPVVLHYEVPMLYVAGQISLTAKHVYTLVLWFGILTTALANAYGFAQRFSNFVGISYTVSLVLCMTLALPISMQSFSVLVTKIYPIFGILGVLILVALIYRAIIEVGKEVYARIRQFICKMKEV
ncbi:MAG: hypothetical protein U9N81_09830 [Bacillota bacterium]|nr:hypothetical protein [Bacillota bacterium]